MQAKSEAILADGDESWTREFECRDSGMNGKMVVGEE